MQESARPKLGSIILHLRMRSIFRYRDVGGPHSASPRARPKTVTDQIRSIKMAQNAYTFSLRAYSALISSVNTLRYFSFQKWGETVDVADSLTRPRSFICFSQNR